MLLTVAAAIAASPTLPQAPSAGVSVQATATIRIISGARLHFGEQAQADADVPPPRKTIIRIGDTEQPARLTEFE